LPSIRQHYIHHRNWSKQYPPLQMKLECIDNVGLCLQAKICRFVGNKVSHGVHEFSLRQGTILQALIEAHDFIIKTPDIS
jgi:hypothetical protein